MAQFGNKESSFCLDNDLATRESHSRQARPEREAREEVRKGKHQPDLKPEVSNFNSKETTTMLARSGD